MGEQVGEKTPEAQWRVMALRWLWPLLPAALWTWGRGDGTVGLWWVGLAVLLQFVAAAVYLARRGKAAERRG